MGYYISVTQDNTTDNKIKIRTECFTCDQVFQCHHQIVVIFYNFLFEVYFCIFLKNPFEKIISCFIAIIYIFKNILLNYNKIFCFALILNNTKEFIIYFTLSCKYHKKRRSHYHFHLRLLHCCFFCTRSYFQQC